MKKVDCKGYAQEILDKVKNWGETHKLGKLYILYGGDDPASASYMRGKLKDAAYCGVPVEQKKFSRQEDMTTFIAELIQEQVDDTPMSEKVGGIIVQLPLPAGWDADKIMAYIPRKWDIDGFAPNSPYKPCTPAGIMHIMNKELGADLSGKDVLLIGKGKLVGNPLIPMLLDAGCTLTVAHSKTIQLESWLSSGFDCIISAVGKPGLIDCEYFWGDPLAIDAGISRDVNGKLCGDMDWGSLEYNYPSRCIKYTTVPGGIGLTTRAMLLKNVALASGATESDFE